MDLWDEDPAAKQERSINITSSCLVLTRGDNSQRAHLLRARVQSPFDQVPMCHADADKRRDAQGRDCGRRAVHGVVADMAVLAVDDDALVCGQSQWSAF